jgi:Arylsulfatase A and related enzymes
MQLSAFVRQIVIDIAKVFVCCLASLMVFNYDACAAPRAANAPHRMGSRHPNVIMIVADDMNHWVHHLGRNRQVITPNLDRLAKRGVTFSNAYCAAPECSPSRAALMSGYRPSTSGIYGNMTDWRKVIDSSKMITAMFRNNGYVVLGTGKIYHDDQNRTEEFDKYYCVPQLATTKEQRRKAIKTLILEPLPLRDQDMPDYKNMSWAIEQLGKKHNKPFFLAYGSKKPHLAWSVPQKYYDMYKGKIELPRVLENDLDDIPPFGKLLANDFPPHDRIQQTMVKEKRWEEAVRAYLACITFTDMNIGRLIDALDKNHLNNDTIVLFFSDHGFHLGEKLHWRKFTLWEEATRVPFIWVAAGVTKPGGVCTRSVDLMSVYPTMANLCGMTLPEHVEGVDITKLLREPNRAWNHPALSTYGFNNHAVRSEEWRYIRYHDKTEELYDEKKDPYEWKNLANDKRLESVKKLLSTQLPALNTPDKFFTDRSTRANQGAQKVRE